MKIILSIYLLFTYSYFIAQRDFKPHMVVSIEIKQSNNELLGRLVNEEFVVRVPACAFCIVLSEMRHKEFVLHRWKS